MQLAMNESKVAFSCLQIVLMCLDHVRLEDKDTPRYFTDSLLESGWPSMEMLTVGTFFDLVTWRSIVLEWLGVDPVEDKIDIMLE